jgi:RNA polymerase sigma-70 factor, ECF subfamily
VGDNAASEVTVLLRQWKSGDRSALDSLTPLVHGELRRLAASYLRRERPDHTLQPTALLNEAYIRLIAVKEQNWTSRSHFFGIAAHLMRLILVDHARGRACAKRGGPLQDLPLMDDWAGSIAAPEKSQMLLDLDQGLQELADFDARKAQVIEMRFFAGMSIDETAEALGISVSTVGREQRLAEAWLNRYLRGVSPST